MKIIKRLFAMAILLALAMPLFAQGYTIYPVPQQMEMGNQKVKITKRINVIAGKGVDQATQDRAKQIVTDAGHECIFSKKIQRSHTNITLKIDASRFTNKGKFDQHCINLTTEGFEIVGEHTNAVFFALASVEQILEQENDGTLTTCQINDFADQQSRGIVEGYYGYPYSVQVKKDLMKFMMRFKMNTYMYGAKSDPYHSQYWQDAYPESITAQQEQNGWLSQAMVSEIAKTSADTKVNFIWAIHPGNSFTKDEKIISQIMDKFEKMHKLGVRQFAAFVDDVGIPNTVKEMEVNATRVTELQRAMEAKWNGKGANPADTVRPLHFVPQIYCSDFARDKQQRLSFMKALGKTPKYITIYTTGQSVWTVPNDPHTSNMTMELGRPMAWWWNYPCNDNADAYIYTMDMYSNFVDLPAVKNNATMPKHFTNALGLVSNPMQQGEVAKIALFSVADYAWNNAAFDPVKSWDASFKAVIKDADIRSAYKFIATYLRPNEPASMKQLIEDYKVSISANKPEGAALRAELQKIAQNCATVEKLKDSETLSDRLLYKDLSPWLLGLNAKSRLLLSMMQIREQGGSAADFENVQKAYNSLLNDEAFIASALEGMGSHITVSKQRAQASRLYLTPFVDYMFRVVNKMK